MRAFYFVLNPVLQSVTLYVDDVQARLFNAHGISFFTQALSDAVFFC